MRPALFIAVTLFSLLFMASGDAAVPATDGVVSLIREAVVNRNDTPSRASVNIRPVREDTTDGKRAHDDRDSTSTKVSTPFVADSLSESRADTATSRKARLRSPARHSDTLRYPDDTGRRKAKADSVLGASDLTSRATYTSRDSISVRLSSDAVLSALPKQIITAVFVVSNAGRRTRRLLTRTEIPEGWLMVRAPAVIELQPGERTVQFATFRIPSDAEAGDFQFFLAFEDEATRALTATAQILMTVETVRTIGFDLISQPEFVAAGDPYEVVLGVSNLGNVAMEVTVEIAGLPKHSLSPSVALVMLEAGETHELKLSVLTDKNITEPTTNRIRMHGSVADHAEIRVAASSSVDIVPVYGRLRPPAEPMGVEVTVGAVGDDHRTGAFYAAEGAGDILGGRLAFDVRFPDRRDVTRFGRRDEYQASFQSDDFALVVGDQSFNLSPLTTSGDYAFGAGGTVHTGIVEVDAFAQRSRFTLFDYALAGGGVQINAPDGSSVGVNVLHRDGLYDGTITTARGVVSPFDGASVDLECGIDDVDGFQNPACALAVGGRSSRFSYRGRLFRTGDDYPGASSALTQGSAGFQWSLPSGVTFRTDLEGLNRDGTSGVARNRYTSLTSIGYRKDAFNGDVQVITSSQEYIGAGSSLDRREQMFRMSSGYQLPAASVSLALDFGHADSDARNYSGEFYAQRLRLQSRPSRRFDVSSFVEHVSGFVSSLPQSVSRWFTGLRIAWLPNNATRLWAGLTHSIDNGLTRRTYTAYEGRLDYELPWGHRISSHVRTSVDDGRFRTVYNDFRVGYTVPLTVPLPNTSEAPRKAFGRVYDSRTGEGVAGVLLHLGDRMTLTDEQGRFRFPASTTEKEYLRVNQRSIGIDQVPHLKMPFPVNPGREDVEVDIPITPGVTLTGTIMRYGNRGGRSLVTDSDPLDLVSPIQGVIVEARTADRTFRSRTNDRGRFIFENIPPGEYEVRIVRANIPDLHKWEADKLTITMNPADEGTVHFKLIPIRRQIRRIDGGSVQVVPGSGK